MEKYLLGRYGQKNPTATSPVIRGYEHAKYTCTLICPLRRAVGGWEVGEGGASPSNSRNNIILPFTVARVIDEDEEKLSCGGLHQPLYVPAALVK